MKVIILTLMLMLGLVVSAWAQAADTLTVKAGKQEAAPRSKLKIKFVEVTEDSRCPMGATCIWAGNAKVRVEVRNRGGGSKTFEVNTTMGPKGERFDGWAIDLVSLTPVPRADGKLDSQVYVAKFKITRLQR
ncbi:MAG: hypothetical protein ABJA02_14555 [Acidobacteriota bacterium]